ncbi:hypothetical protein TREES_T100021640 [Tupaia chinensis]|uniref:Uncharacterized protein n=1 Tax=Tupaia chinensis TaxID=246437 RepID=L9JVY8_TUPCH|nr:hypothetical protein TREES_T100021640 [Tupaia chinensis]
MPFPCSGPLTCMVRCDDLLTRAVHSGTRTLWVQCAVNEYDAVLHYGLGADQFVIGWIADNIEDLRFECTTL